MQLPRCWIGIDVVGTHLQGEIVVHSVAGRRAARPLRRIAYEIGLKSRGAEQLFKGVVTDLLGRPATDHTATEAGLECRSHWIKAPDGTPLGLIVWLAEPPPLPPPVYNAWILDLDRVTTRSSGDDLSLIGDGRKAGEERPIRDLLCRVNPDDAPAFLSLYYDALTGEKGLLAEAMWSVRAPTEDQWIHFWSAAHVGGIGTPDDSGRSLYGLTMRLDSRELDTRLGTVVAFTNSTLLMVDADHRVPLATTGELAPMDAVLIGQVLDQIDLDQVIASRDNAIERDIWLTGRPYRAKAFRLPTAQKRPVHPVAIVLRAHDTPPRLPAQDADSPALDAPGFAGKGTSRTSRSPHSHRADHSQVDVSKRGV
ncbi:hypothetical protein [Nocardia brasiliensis]|uniref:hypothetical protein n=1 Tax=Nocardia brasiliensis TaxID=37326 RepID=UPI00366E6F00